MPTGTRSGIYRDIGVRPFINCCGTRTVHGGTLMRPCVRDAMAAASEAFVNMDELMDGAGRRIAELTGAGAAIVTSGGSAAFTVAAAASVTKGDPERMQRLPDTAGMPDRVVMLRTGRFTYDQALRAVGVRVVEVATRAELDRELASGAVALVALLGEDRSPDRLTVREVCGAASARGVPVLVDAASELPALPNPYLAGGAAMVAYSGGKVLRGPQPTGILIGEPDWIRAAWLNAAPHHAFGRMMKVGKEEVMGLLAAIEHWANGRDGDAEAAQWTSDLEAIAGRLASLDGVAAEILDPGARNPPVPRLEIRWDARAIPLHGLDVRAELLDHDPRIMLDDRGATECSLFILPFSLQPGEAGIVGDALRACLERAGDAPRSPARPRAPACDLTGLWDVTVRHPAGTSGHRFSLRQTGAALTGTHRLTRLESPVEGRIEGSAVDLESTHPFEGTNLAYRFRGTVEDNGASMRGTVEMGTEGQSAPGPLNRREYGEAEWTARRVEKP